MTVVCHSGLVPHGFLPPAPALALSSVQQPLQSLSPCCLIPAQHGPSLHIQSSPSLPTPAHLLSTPHCRLCSVDDRLFSIAGPQLWNVKPQGLCQCTSVASSKVQLQTRLCGPAALTHPALMNSIFLLSRVHSSCNFY